MTSLNGDQLTYRENLVFQFIRTYTETHGYGPSIREMADASHLASTSSVAYILTRLERKGYIIRLGGRQAVSVVPSHAGKVVVSRNDLATVLMSADADGGPNNAAVNDAWHRLMVEAEMF